MTDNTKRKLRKMGAKISTWTKKPNTCPAAECWKCKCRIGMGKTLYERVIETNEFRGDDKVSWACVNCMTKETPHD